MEITGFDIPDIKVVRADVAHEANRSTSYFYDAAAFEKGGVSTGWVQDHASFYPVKGTVRGLHFQQPPIAQHKLVRVSRGRVFDVAVDVRKTSPTYGRYVSIELSAENWIMLFVPIGFAHGFCTLEPDTEVVFRITQPNTAGYLGGLFWNDPALQIPWPCGDRPNVIFPVDETLPTLDKLNSPF